MATKKYEKLITRKPLGKSKQPEITVPTVNYRGDIGGRDLTFDWSCISKPFAMRGEPQANDFDQFLFFAGSNLEDFNDFRAEIELPLGKKGKKYIIAEPKFVYIPLGLIHGPLNFKKVDKPIAYMHFSLSPKLSKASAESDYAKFMAKPAIMTTNLEIKTFMNERMIRQQKMSYQEMNCEGNRAGGGNFSIFWYTVKEPHVMQEPVHSHHFDMWVVFLGGNPLNVGDFDAEIEMFWGEEAEKQTITTTSIVHIPPELIHRSIDYRRVGKPFTHLNLFTFPEYRKDQIFSKPGEIEMAEGTSRRD